MMLLPKVVHTIIKCSQYSSSSHQLIDQELKYVLYQLYQQQVSPTDPGNVSLWSVDDDVDKTKHD